MKNSVDQKAQTALEKALPLGLTSLLVKEKRYVLITDLDGFIAKFKEITGCDLEIEYCPKALYFYRFNIKPKQDNEQSNNVLNLLYEGSSESR